MKMNSQVNTDFFDFCICISMDTTITHSSPRTSILVQISVSRPPAPSSRCRSRFVNVLLNDNDNNSPPNNISFSTVDIEKAQISRTKLSKTFSHLFFSFEIYPIKSMYKSRCSICEYQPPVFICPHLKIFQLI